MKNFAVVLLIICLLLVCAAMIDAQAVKFESPKPVIIDTDMAADDWMAILYLLRRADVNVLALTIAGTGEAHCNPGVQRAMSLVQLGGHPDIPVACGRETPLQGMNAFPEDWRTWVDNLGGLSLPANPAPVSSQTAVELLASVIETYDAKVTLLTLGPLTNIAELLQRDPSLVQRIDMIYVMGGALDVAGNVAPIVNNDYAEWNIYVDPQAAEQVLESGVPMTFIGLDATNRARLTIGFYDRLTADKTTPEAEFVHQALTQQMDFVRSGYYYFWDPLAAAVLTDESLARFQGRPVRVMMVEGDELGRIVLDGSGYRARFAIDVDAPRFEQVFLNVLNGRDPAADA